MQSQEDFEVAEILQALDEEEIEVIKSLFYQICEHYETQTVTLDQTHNFLNDLL
jgi:hypothetical protein